MDLPAANPTSRALAALEILQGTPGITADRLGARLGVSDRAARRYVEVLREAGVPIESSRGRYGGYRVGRGVRVPLVFTPAEALGLVMAVLDGHHDAAGDDPVGTALGKIVRTLPERAATQAATVRRATAPAPDRAAARPDAATTSTLVLACADRRRVRVGYRSESGREWTTDVDPWAVVVRHGRWYLVCRSLRADAVRAYRVDRVTAVEVLDEAVDPVPPADLDPVEALEENLASGWEYEVQVRVEAPAADVRRRLPRTLGRVEPVDEHSCRLVGSTSNPVWYAEQLAGLTVPYRVLGGPQVRRAVRSLGLRLLAAAADD